jgi:hypothetical protein
MYWISRLEILYFIIIIFCLNLKTDIALYMSVEDLIHSIFTYPSFHIPPFAFLNF